MAAPPFQLRGRVEGADQLRKNLEELGSTKARAVSRRAIVSASSDPLKAAKKNAPRRTGRLRKSLGKKAKTYRASGTTVVVIGPRPGFQDPETGDNPVNYAHLVELGTQKAAAKPFIRPALIQTQHTVIRNYGDKLGAGIEREAARMKK